MREIRHGSVVSAGRLLRRGKYAAYMKSAAWYERRKTWADTEKQILARSGRESICCVLCEKVWSVSRDDLHHISYDRLGAEYHEDLWPMCRACHTLIHELLRTKNMTRIPYRQANFIAAGILRNNTTSKTQSNV